MAWQDDLQPASWNGVPFGMDAAELLAGRNTAVHAYPFRETDPAWVEDAGLAPNATRLTGYLVGDDVAAQQDAMLAAVQMPGQGELVHPMRGSLTGSIVGGCRFTLRKDRGRYIELSFAFIENDQNGPYPTSVPDGQTGVAVAAAATQAAARSDYQYKADLPGPGHA